MVVENAQVEITVSFVFVRTYPLTLDLLAHSGRAGGPQMAADHNADLTTWRYRS